MADRRAVIDADTLYRRHARNLLVWHALEGLFHLHWSRRIVDETRRNLIPNVTLVPPDRAEKVDRILNRVTEAIYASGAGTEVPEAEIAPIENEMTNNPKDRHVLAAAVACGADTIVTTNTKDFPLTATATHGITAKSPDEFLVSLLSPATRDAALEALRNQAEFHRWSVPGLLNFLGSAGPHGPAIAPSYVKLIESGR
jgi:predicted nucleic acid-binding protein